MDDLSNSLFSEIETYLLPIVMTADANRADDEDNDTTLTAVRQRCEHAIETTTAM